MGFDKYVMFNLAKCFAQKICFTHGCLNYRLALSEIRNVQPILGNGVSYERYAAMVVQSVATPTPKVDWAEGVYEPLYCG